ncbi:MAG: hypothetical protein AB2689_01510 [Candidatus Thiodiazotropha taylori]|nr:hypothetical protein [Candidatus Thiodiazotropha taylori]
MEENTYQDKEEGKTEKTLNAIAFGLPNVLGLLIFIPLLFGVGMSFDSPNSGKHWAHWYFVASNVLLGPLCLIALFSKKRRHWGLIGYGLAFSGWLILTFVCSGKFTCG